VLIAVHIASIVLIPKLLLRILLKNDENENKITIL